VKRPIYQGGKLVGHDVVYSDNLLLALLKARRPEKYRDRQLIEHRVTLEKLVTMSMDPTLIDATPTPIPLPAPKK
jgi:hypothetical protein